MSRLKILLILILAGMAPVSHAYRDIETGTFLTRDPIGYADGPNLYCYVHCNPITQFDPFGLKTLSDAEKDIEKATQERQQALEKWQDKKDSGGFWSDRTAERARQRIESRYEKKVTQAEGTMRSILGMADYMNRYMGKNVDPFDLDTDSSEFKEGIRHLIDHQIVPEIHKDQAVIVGSELGMGAVATYVKSLRAARAVKAVSTAGKGVTILEREGSVVVGSFQGAAGEARVVSEVVRQGDTIILRGAHIEGQGTLKEALNAAKEFGRSQGVKNVIIEGGVRTTGANPGHIPRPITVRTGL